METAKPGTIQLTKEGFLTQIMDYEKNPTEWKYLGDKPCIIDFYADWCGPCKMVAPILELLAEKYHGKINIYKIDTEVERELAGVFGIRSIPTILFCPMDDNPHQVNGALQRDMFEKLISELLLKEEEA